MPVDLLDGLKRSRAGTRAAVTRTINRLREPRTEEVSFEDVEVDVEYIVARKATLQDLDSQILALTGEDQYDQEVQSILEYEQQLEAAITRARRVLRTAGQLTSPVAQSAALGDSSHRESTSHSVSLPKLQIPKFGGKLQDWRARFWEHFQATIHNNGALAPVEKFKYLLCYVTDEAKRAIDGISLSDAYQTAVDALKQRFGRTDVLAAEHIDKLLSLRAVQGSREATQLRRLCDEVSRHTRASESLAIPHFGSAGGRSPQPADNMSPFLQTAVVQVAGPGGSASVRILLDNGSQRTVITQELAQRLRCPGLASENLSIFAFGSTQPSTRRAYQKVSLRIEGLHQ
ncbi:uncharacterized protein LOC135388253 [Ornithodoros turicata]|uniref:uncharacterized protein LOC135388253 n=1 Tax=Ornithodoros turicata TaxID=34597 RepID=UPI00313979CE